MAGVRPNRSVFVPRKRAYVRGRRPAVSCILCAVAAGDPRVDNLVVHETRRFLVTLNLFPYNPGHLMIFPRRHVDDPRRLSRAEEAEMLRLQRTCMNVLERRYRPHGWNFGLNVGHAGGASIDHIHLHIVPRFRNEIGFLDVIAGTRVHVDDPSKARRALRAAFRRG